MRRDIKKWQKWYRIGIDKKQSGEVVPHYCKRSDEWRCMVVGFDGKKYEERGSLEWVISEFSQYNEVYQYTITENKDDLYSHSHTFDGVLLNLIENPEYFSIENYEDQYSEQQKTLIHALREKILKSR